MQRIFEPYQFSDLLRYDAHTLCYHHAGSDEEVRIRGILGAALMSALLVDTPEGDHRHIAVDSDHEREEWFDHYEREMRGEGWALWREEVFMLNETYVSLSVSTIDLSDICPNIRLLDLAFELMLRYMQRLTREQVGDDVFYVTPLCRPFGTWLLNAAACEYRRNLYLSIDWTEPAQVVWAAEDKAFNDTDNDAPGQYKWTFDNLSSAQVFAKYFKWLETHIEQAALQHPKSKSVLAHLKSQTLREETNPDFLPTELNLLAPADRKLFDQWMDEWTKYITRKLKPERPVRFWENGVDNQLREQFTDYLRAQERQPMYYKCLATAVYALRYLGYVNRACKVSKMIQWLSEHLANNYLEKNRAMQFRRAWDQLSRYSPEVTDEVKNLANYGIYRFNQKPPKEEEENYLPSLSSTDLT